MKTQVDLSNFAEGALQEKFDKEFQKILGNIQDPNTEWKKPRKLVMELTFKTDEDRELSMVNILVKSTLALSKDTTSRILIGMDGKGGYLANELKTQVPGQQRMRVDTETGEVIDKEPANYEGITLVK